MMKYMQRLTIACAFALLVAGATYMLAQAKAGINAPAQQEQKVDCLTCHPKFNEAWQASAHGHAITDPKFNQMWTDQGKPGACLVCHVTGYDPGSGAWQKDGVACEACHGPVPAAHSTNPTANPVPVDRSSDLCGRCHSGARFDVQQWQSSAHFQRGMTCTMCHDPHSATLKTVGGMQNKGPSALCINCHNEVSMNFPYSKHNQAGVSCVDCHLRHFGQGNQDVHAVPDHSFQASLDTCNTCHADQMHAQPEKAVSAVSGPVTQAASLPTPGPVMQDPAPVSPLGFAGLAGLLGLAGGMVLSPWLDKAYRKINKRGRPE
jgi:predicted CXXCH cytochrome family protein